MTWFADGSPCTYFQDFDEGARRPVVLERLVAIGWLDGSYEYERGPVEPEFENKLGELVASAWQPVGFCGPHSCNLLACSRLPYMRRASGVHNLFVPADGFAYASPELIVHYISEHGYAPPERFRAAVMACPRMSSDAFFDAMSKNGPTQWRQRS